MTKHSLSQQENAKQSEKIALHRRKTTLRRGQLRISVKKIASGHTRDQGESESGQQRTEQSERYFGATRGERTCRCETCVEYAHHTTRC